jgi:hypothetical protein
MAPPKEKLQRSKQEATSMQEEVLRMEVIDLRLENFPRTILHRTKHNVREQKTLHEPDKHQEGDQEHEQGKRIFCTTRTWVW